MSARTIIYGRATAYSGLTDLIGTRCYPAGEIPESVVVPYIQYQRVALNTEMHLDRDGPAEREVGQFQFDCYADTHDNAVDVARQVMGAFHIWDSEDVGWCRVTGMIGNFAPPIGQRRAIVTMRMEYRIE